MSLDTSAALAVEIVDGVRRGWTAEQVEAALERSFAELIQAERDRCVRIAEHRALMWESSLEKYGAGSWPDEAIVEARERRKEAIVIADALLIER